MSRFLALVLSCVACASAPTDPMQAYIGHRLSLFADRLDTEGGFALSDLRGKVVLVDVFASWCVPCRDAVPAWRDLRASNGGALEVVAVSIDGERAMAEDYFAEVTPGFPMVWDRHGTFTGSYPIENLPTLFLLDREGIVRHVHVGFNETTAAEIALRVRDLL